MSEKRSPHRTFPQKPTTSPILRTVAFFAVPLTLFVSAIIFFQGHNLPGGGFIAGVLGVAAGAIYLLAHGTERAAKIAWWKISVVGLAVSLGTGVALMIFNESFMNHTVLEIAPVPILNHFPTATFFDIGVYMIVLGTLMTIFVELGQE